MLDRELALAYQVLGLDLNASESEARKARLALVRRFHPDLYQGDRGKADQKLARINAAFDDVLAHLNATGRGTTAAERKTDQDQAHANDARRRAAAMAEQQRAALRDRARQDAARKAARMRAAMAAIEGAEARLAPADRRAHRAAKTGFGAVQNIATDRRKNRISTTV